MNYHDIVKDDMRNGTGLRVTLFVSGCKHHCTGCHNPQTWDPNSGILFDDDAYNELKEKLNKDYIDGITFSGGDPLFVSNRDKIKEIAEYVKSIGKTVWLYTGYKLKIDNDRIYLSNDNGDDFDIDWLNLIDVMVDSPFDIELLDQSYPWAGSTNQRVIDIQKTINKKEIVLFKEKSIIEKEFDPRECTCGCDRNS